MKKLRFLGIDTGFGLSNTAAYIIRNNNLLLIDCGNTVFSKLFKMDTDSKFLNNKNKIEVIITHMHDDHVGSLSMLVLYCYHQLGKKITIYTKCESLTKRLQIAGVPLEAFEIKESDEITFIKTDHAQELDCYGFTMMVDNKRIVYTGDTRTLEPFIKYINGNCELYVDVSYYASKAHLYFKDIKNKLLDFANRGIDVFLMHIDSIDDFNREVANTKLHLASDDKLYKEDIIKILKNYNFNVNEYIVISGAAMVLHGYKEYTRDIDLAVSSVYYNQLLKEYDCTLERVNEEGECIFFIDGMINFGHTYYCDQKDIINGLPVQTKEELIKLKSKLKRKKDIRELELIK